MTVLSNLVTSIFGHQRQAGNAGTHGRFNGLPFNRLHSFRQFKALHPAQQLQQLRHYGTDLRVAHKIKSVSFTLFAYHDFYVEVVEDRYTGRVRSVNCFRTPKMLKSYLQHD